MVVTFIQELVLLWNGEKVKSDVQKASKRNMVSLVTIGGYVQ